MITIGVDPGLRGGIAALEAGHRTIRLLVPMPIIRPNGRGRDQYDVTRIVALLRQAQARGSCTAVVEKLHALPPDIARGGIANYNRGAAYWLFVGILAALEIPMEAVLPRVWQREMLEGTPAGDTKQRSILAASRLFPGVSLLPGPRARKPSDGLSDALLLAAYGQRRLIV